MVRDRLYHYTLLTERLNKSYRSESVDEEAVVEQILHVFVHVWKREHAIINRFLDRVYADGMQPTSKHGKTVRNIAQCILIALLNNIEQLSDLHDLMPRLRLERMPVFLLTSTSGLRNLVQLLLVEDRGELETYLQVVVMSKLEAWSVSSYPYIVQIY